MFPRIMEIRLPNTVSFITGRFHYVTILNARRPSLRSSVYYEFGDRIGPRSIE